MSNSNFTEEFIKEEIIEKTDAILGRLEQCNLIRLFASQLRKEIEKMKGFADVEIRNGKWLVEQDEVLSLLPPNEKGEEQGKE